LGKEIDTAREFTSFVRGIRGHNMAKAGMETALWDLEAALKQVALWQLLGGTREKIDCGVSIGIKPSIEKLLETIEREVKPATDASRSRSSRVDVEVVRQVRSAFPSILLMADKLCLHADVDLFREWTVQHHDVRATAPLRRHDRSRRVAEKFKLDLSR
jgi:O-succinylbenzoate synthase